MDEHKKRNTHVTKHAKFHNHTFDLLNPKMLDHEVNESKRITSETIHIGLAQNIINLQNNNNKFYSAHVNTIKNFKKNIKLNNGFKNSLLLH